LGGKESRRGFAPASPSGIASLKPCFLSWRKILNFCIKSGFSPSEWGSRGIAPCGADGATPRQNLNFPKGWGLGGLKPDKLQFIVFSVIKTYIE